MPSRNRASSQGGTFGAYLRLLRKRARLTQCELGIATGYSEGQICRFERGHVPPDPATLSALFVPALGLTQSPADVARLVELAAALRGDDLTAMHITRSYATATGDGDSLTLAFDWYLNHQPDAALRLAQSMVPLWWAHGDHHLARRRLAEVLRAGGDDITIERATLLLNSAIFANEQHAHAEGRQLAEQALAVAQSLNHPRLMAESLHQLAWSAHLRNDTDSALLLFAEALALYRVLNLLSQAADCLIAMSHLSVGQAGVDAAMQMDAWLDEAEHIARRLKLPKLMFWLWSVRAERAQVAGDVEAAIAMVDRALHLAPRINNLRLQSWALALRGELLSEQGRHRAARTALQAAGDGFDYIGDGMGQAAVNMHLAILLRRQGKKDQARAALVAAQARAEAQGHPVFALRCLLHQALLARETDDPATLHALHADMRACLTTTSAAALRLNGEERAELARMLQRS
jgi:tetratricopeptide (TPR) repeat protein